MTGSRTHLVVIPSYNAGHLLNQTVTQALAEWAPVWVVVDGSTDGSAAALSANDARLTVIDRPHNNGKGAAVLDALLRADQAGFTHALVMDSDGQHPPQCIKQFMTRSMRHPERIYARRLSNLMADVETGWAGIGDSLFGFRVYPLRPLLRIMRCTGWMRRFDFDAEAAVRLCWSGIRPMNVDIPVRYLSAAEGGVSHFRYGRDNLLLTWMHLRLLFGLLRRLPSLARGRPIGADGVS
jgi:glycosyltransferase involved in cell wall biosynthesis